MKYVFVGAILCMGLLLRFGNLNHDLWYDESGQFWLARGQSLFNLDFQDRGLIDVLNNNRQINFDPPLFSLILHYWSRVNTSIIWLRLLPSIFGILTLIYIYKTLRYLKLYSLIVILVTLLAVLTNVFIYYSQELRAYSLGMLSSIMMFYYLLVYLGNYSREISITLVSPFALWKWKSYLQYVNKPLNKLIFSTLIAIGSLYSLWLLTFITGLLVFWHSLKYKKYQDIFIYLVPVSLMAFVIFINQTSYQLNGFTLGYTDEFKVGNYTTLSQILYKIVQYDLGYIYYILHLPNLTRDLALLIISSPFYLIIFIGTIFLLITYLLRLVFHAPNSLKLPIIFFLMLQLEIHVLSLINKFPLGGNRWNLFHSPVFLIILGIIFHLILKKLSWSRTVIIFLIVGLIFLNGVSVYQTPRKVSFMRDVLEIIPFNNGLVYLFSYGAVPTFKYHYQYTLNNFNPTLVYYTHHLTNDPSVSIADLSVFLKSSQLTQNQLSKKITILLSGESLSTENMVRLLIKNYIKEQNYSMREYLSGEVLAFTIIR